MLNVKVTQKNKIILFLLLILLNAIIRIPSIHHEKGNDSFLIHILSNSITTFGEANWLTNFPSIFGLYPASYASGLPFILSGISQITNIEMEITILLFSVVLGLLSLYTSYLLGGIIYNNFIFKFIFSLFFSLSQGVLIFTTWEISSRGLFIVLFPLHIYLLIKCLNKFDIRIIILILINTALLFTTHNFAYFAVYLFGFMIFYSLFKNKVKLSHKISIILYTILFLIFSLLPFLKRTLIVSGSKYSWMITTAVIETRFVGPLIILLIGGISYLVLKYPKKIEESFILFCSIALIPIIYSQIYGHYVWLIFSIFFISISFRNIIVTKQKYNKIFAILLIIFFVAFSSFYNHWRTGQNSRDWYMDDETFSSGIWAKEYINDTVSGIGNSDVTVRRFLAISDGHPNILSEDVVANTYGLINVSQMSLIQNSPLSMNFYFDGPYVLEPGQSIDGKINWIIQQQEIDGRTSHEILRNYNVDYFIMDTNNPTPIFNSLKNKMLIYDNKRIQIFIIN
ncbi:MAG: hypothetical protein MIO93_02620 [ANME-2 cluster archaeon]|nr:hypothetical protein [ANME-2 cluster archaeon]